MNGLEVMPVSLKWCSRHNGGKGEWLSNELFKSYPTACTACRNAYDRSKRRGKQTIAQAYSSCKCRAKRAGMVFEITKTAFTNLVARSCAYGKGKRPEIRISLDRKDSTKGYTLENCVPCCPRHNEIKMHWFTYDEMRRIVLIAPNASHCGNTNSGSQDYARSWMR